jgi:hypothetical protein
MKQAPVVIQTPVTNDAKRINLVVHISTEVIAPEVARKRANGWLVDNVGNLLLAETPELLAGEKMVWRIQVVLSYPTRGRVGTIGTIDLDAVTGEVLANDAVIERLHTDAAHSLYNGICTKRFCANRSLS